MKISRFTAKDMRQALKLVRDQLGTEAVILTSKRTPFGVEVTAAIDFDAARVEQLATNEVLAVANGLAQGQSRGQPPAQGHGQAHSSAHAQLQTNAHTQSNAQARGQAVAGSHEPRPFRPEEFAPQPVAPSRAAPARRAPQPEHDPYADVHQDDYSRAEYTRAEEDVQQSVFARIKAEMQEAAAEQRRAPRAVRDTRDLRDTDTTTARPGRDLHDGRDLRDTRESDGLAARAKSALRDFHEARDAAAHDVANRAGGGDYSPAEQRASIRRERDSELRPVPVPTASRAIPSAQAATAPGNATPTATATNARDWSSFEETTDDVHAALESAIDSYMSGGSLDNNRANPSHAAPRNERLTVVPTPARASTVTGAGPRAAAIGAAAVAGDTATAAKAAKPADPLICADDIALGDDDENESPLGAELKAMRRILETQMAQLAWNDLTRRAPIHTEILRSLTELGLSQDFAAQIVAQLPAGTDLTKARRLSVALVSQRIQVTGDRWLDKGGRVALVGPTGVGKTTALAKLAVRWVLRHGARSIALISADSVRLGAHDQLQALGQMLDVPVYVAESLDQIPKLLAQLEGTRFVLVDTPGMSQRDAQLETRMNQLADAGHGVETALVLSASTQAGAIAETVARFAAAKASSALLTKVDEAASLGGILSVLAKAELPISYVSEGQRVPEDLRPARALELVSSAVQLAKSSGAAADEDLLRRRYGEVAHALA